jgi:hypothetical protein
MRPVNAAQTKAAKKVQGCLAEVMEINKSWAAADRRLKRAQDELRREINRDPESWAKLARVAEQ